MNIRKKTSKESKKTDRLAPRALPSELSKNRSSSSTRMYYRPAKSKPGNAINKSTLDSSVDKQQKRRISFAHSTELKRLPSLAILLAFMVLIFFASTLSGGVVIKTAANSYEYRPLKEYQQGASQLLANTSLNKSKLLFRSDSYENDLLELFPEIESASALLPLGGRDLTVQIRTSQPLAKIQSNDGEAKIVNETGALVVLGRHSPQTQSLPLIVLDATYASSLSQGDQVLTQSEVELIKLAMHEISSESMKVAGVQGVERIVVSITDGEVLIYLRGVPYYLKLSSYSQLEQQIGAVVASIDDLTKKNEAPLEYLDVRVPGRVFVK